MNDHELQRIKAQQALVDALPPEMKQIVWEHGFAALPEMEMRRYRALVERKKGRPKDRPRVVAPVIEMPEF